MVQYDLETCSHFGPICPAADRQAGLSMPDRDQLVAALLAVVQENPAALNSFGYYAPENSGLLAAKAASGHGLVQMAPVLRGLLALAPSAQLNHVPLRQAISDVLRTHPGTGAASSADKLAGCLMTSLAHLRRVKGQVAKWRQATRFLAKSPIEELRLLCELAESVAWGTLQKGEEQPTQEATEARPVTPVRRISAKSPVDIWSSSFDTLSVGTHASQQGGLRRLCSEFSSAEKAAKRKAKDEEEPKAANNELHVVEAKDEAKADSTIGEDVFDFATKQVYEYGGKEEHREQRNSKGQEQQKRGRVQAHHK